MGSLRDLAAGALDGRPMAAVLSTLERADRGGSDRAIVLTYHRIDHPGSRPHLAPSLLSATPERFEAQIAFLARSMRPLSLEQLMDAVRSGRAPSRAVHVTIDDAYCDVLEHAWPILRRYGVPATLFVPTGMPGAATGFWWDRIHHALVTTRRERLRWRGRDLELATPAGRAAAFRVAHDTIRDLPDGEAKEGVRDLLAACEVSPAPPEVLSWDELGTLARDGLALAPHTRSHPRLDRLDVERAVVEIEASVDDLAARIGAPVHRILAYPHGDHGPPAVEAAARAGIEAAFTTTRGAIDLPARDVLRLRRINVGRRASIGAIRLQAGRWMRLARR